jgi:hypothetical protein
MGNNATPTTAPQRRRRRYRTTAALILTGALAVAACGGDDDDSSDASADFGEATSEEPARSDASDGGFIATGDAAEPIGDSDGGGFDIGIIGRDVIIEMRVVLSSDNIQRTVSSIMAHASSLGGGVASSDVDYGSQGDFGSEGYAVLVVKVPPQSVDSLLAGLDDTGTVQSINQSAQDVTEQLIDLEVRISNARQSVANVRDFMDRTENLNELVTLEGELTRRQTELERLEAQQRNLSDRVALSTVTIEVIPTASVPEPIDEDSDTISDAFEKGWDAFTGFIFGIGFILAVLLPFLALAAIVGLLGWAIARRRRRHQPVAATPLPEPEPVATPSATVSSTDAEPANQQD